MSEKEKNLNSTEETLQSAEAEEKKGKKSNDTDIQSRVYEVSDEESTIFSSPSEHRDRVKKGVKAKKIVLSVVALLVVAAIIVTVVLTIPKLTPENTSSVAIEYDLMSLYDYSKVNRVDLIRDDGTVKFHTIEKETVEYDDYGNEVTGTEKQWALVEVDDSLTSYSTIDNTVTTYMGQTYTKLIAEDKGDGTDYGFDDPEYQVDFYNENETEPFLSLYIGDYNPTESGRYATTSLDNAVYYINGESSFYQYKKNEVDFVQAESIPAIAADETYSDDHFTEGTLIMAEKLELWGKNIGGEYTVITKESDNVTVFNNYHITSPVSRPANDDTMGNIVSLFSYGIDATGCYSYTTTEADLKKFGLDDPDFGVTIYVNDVTSSFIAALQDDGYYAVYYEDCKTLLKVDADSLSPIDIARKDLFNELLFIENISSSSMVTVESGGEKIEFSISSVYNEESGSDTISTVKVNGENITTLNFQEYYNYIISIGAVSYDEYDTSDMEPTTVFTFYHKDGSDPTVVEYYQISSSRYQVETNGVKMGLISSADHNRIMKYAKNVAEDKTYNSR